MTVKCDVSSSQALQLLLGFYLLILNAAAAAAETEIRAHVGTTIALPCKVDTQQCGSLHSVKWYRETSRIYVFSHVGGIARAEGDATDRMKVLYTESSVQALLKISPVHIEDEATYKCEITYLEVREHCDVVQIVKLTTLVKPEAIRIIGNDGTPLVNSSILGPLDEGTDVELICEATGGKPVPKITWYNRSTEMKYAKYVPIVGKDGVGVARSLFKLTLSKGDLTARFECRVESDALDGPIISWIIADVYVRPSRMEISKVNRRIIAGEQVMLMCDVFGARPEAKVEWFNGTSPVDESLYESKAEDNRDGTYTTKSTLVFTASRFENGKTFHCNAENQVTKNYNEPALHDNVLIEILYPPVVTVSPRIITVNESSTPLLLCNYVANPQELQGIIWSKDDQNLTITPERYEGGTIKNPPLRIKNVTREDMGSYHCWLKNSIDMKKSDKSIFLNVQYPPNVAIYMEPNVPVKAVDKSTVNLECNVTKGNPSNLLKVAWYLGGELMKELPECNYTVFENGTRDNGGPLCGVDPTILTLERVDQSFAGNYTCQGQTAAGWGMKSEPQELVVYYPPTPAKLRFYPSKVIKMASVNLECTVDDPGKPDNITYLWYRGSHLINEITTSTWTISPVTLETRANFTCIPQNDGGQGKPDTKYISVDAPPSFIQNLIPYQGVLYNSKNISLTCRVECWPICSIVWFIDGKPLNKDTSKLYYVKTEIYPSVLGKNDFESVESTLVWNLTAWPENQLNKSTHNTIYTCQSFANGVGPGVTSSSEIAVDYAPEAVAISYQETISTSPNQVINVKEGQPISPIKCIGKGHPTLTFTWKSDSNPEYLTKSDTLQINALTRQDNTRYTCSASNKYGTQYVKIYFNVQYVPTCSVTMMQREGKPTLLCTAKGNPEEITFTWKVKESNETLIDPASIVQEGLSSYLRLDSVADASRTYVCYANNSIGIGEPCERGITGTRPWWNSLEDENKLIIIAITSAILILCVIAICIIIIILCRRERAQAKSPNLSSGGDKHAIAPLSKNPDGPISDREKIFYENLPFHSLQNPPDKSLQYLLTTPRKNPNSNLDQSSKYSSMNSMLNCKHSKLISNSFSAQKEQPNHLKTKSLQQKSKHKKHFQIPLQKCHTFRLPNAQNYFHPIGSLQDDNLRSNGYISNSMENLGRNSTRSIKDTSSYLNSNLMRGFENYNSVQFQNSLQLQYPQLKENLDKTSKTSESIRELSKKMHYADLDIPKPTKNAKYLKNNEGFQGENPHKVHQEPKTEYATLAFDQEIGHEIDPFYPDMCELDYADLMDDQYGPINYKAASVYAIMKKNKVNRLEEVNDKDKYNDLL